MKKIVKCYAFIIILFMFVSRCYGYGYLEHKRIWDECFNYNTKYEPIYIAVSNAIDQEAGGRSKSLIMQNIYQISNNKFNWGIYGHRIFFHWGYDSRLEETRCWYKIWKRKILPGFESKEDKIKNMLKREWENRKQIVEDVAIKKIGIDEKKAHALCSLLYNIHILSDYESSRKYDVELPLQDIYDLHREATNDIRVLFSEDEKIEILLRQFYVPHGMVDKARSREMLKQLISILKPLSIKNKMISGL